MELSELIINFLGFLILAVSLYMITVNLILPRLHIPWLGERRAQQWIERGEWLLERENMSEEDRAIVEVALATLRRHDQQAGESWSWSDPRREAMKDLQQIHERYRDQVAKEPKRT